jgi:adenylate cyclase
MLTRKKQIILFLACWSLANFSLFSQIDSIGPVEAEQDALARKMQIIVKGLDDWEKEMSAGNYRAAAHTADQLYELAKREKALAHMALTLNRSGKAAAAANDNRKARKQFWESFALSQQLREKELSEDNLLELRRLAEKTLRKSEIQAVDQQLAALRRSGELPKGPLTPPSPGVGVSASPSVREREAEIFRKLQETTRELNAAVNALNVENRSLQLVIRNREEEIEAMTEAQMRQELLLAQQRNLLDSLSIKALRDSLLLANTEFQLQERNAKLKIQQGQRNLLLALAAIVIIMAGGLYARYLGIRSHNAMLEEKNRLIREEQRRSEELLLNILPAAVAHELKTTGAARTRQYEQVTVLFADFRNFSQIAHQLSPEELVRQLDYCFIAFDRIVEKHKLEKIKTIGDAYMGAGGLPDPDPDHPRRMLEAAQEMQQFLLEWEQESASRGAIFRARIGMHTGPIVAGVVGVKKFAYDIWGDTVNVAARMEEACEPGRINISATTYALVKDGFQFAHRGKIPAKNMGEIDMYYLEG